MCLIHLSWEMELTLGVVSLLPNVDDKILQVNLPQLFFFISLHFFCCLLLKNWSHGFLMCYSLYIQYCSLFEKAPSEIPAGGTEKTELKREENARRDLYNRLRWYPNKSKRQKGAFIVKLTVGFPKVGAMIVQPDGIRLDTGDTHRNTHWKFADAHIRVHKNTHIRIRHDSPLSFSFKHTF